MVSESQLIVPPDALGGAQPRFSFTGLLIALAFVTAMMALMTAPFMRRPVAPARARAGAAVRQNAGPSVPHGLAPAAVKTVAAAG